MRQGRAAGPAHLDGHPRAARRALEDDPLLLLHKVERRALEAGLGERLARGAEPILIAAAVMVLQLRRRRGGGTTRGSRSSTATSGSFI